MEADINAWVRSILSKRNLFEEEAFIISIGWDAFLYGLSHYKDDNIPIEKHFHRYAQYYINKRLKKEGIISSKDVPEEIEECPGGLFVSLLDLKSFRETLPKAYKEIFDDALLNMENGGPPTAKKKKSVKGINSHRYNEAKRMMKFFIRFMLEKKQ